MSKEEIKPEKVEEKTEEIVKKTEPIVTKTPVEETPVEECDHKGKLEAVSGEVPRAVERHHDIFRCKSCGAIVVKDKK